MIAPAYVRLMAAYNAEMNRRTYAAAGRLDEAGRRADRGAFWGSIHGTLNHILWADRVWMSRFTGAERPAQGIRDSGTLYDGFHELNVARLAEDARIAAWADGVDQAWIDQDLVWFSVAMRSEMRRPRAVVLIHFFNHQTHHRGQVHALLTASGQDTGDTDLPIVLGDLERAGQAPA
jgi:uncharacterized damage-inducible protein DinB